MDGGRPTPAGSERLRKLSQGPPRGSPGEAEAGGGRRSQLTGSHAPGCCEYPPIFILSRNLASEAEKGDLLLEPAGITDLLLLCARFEALRLEPKEREALLSEIRLALAEVFHVLTVVLAANPKWRAWTVDHKHPGYLTRSVHGTEVRVPWNLLKDFPPDQVLQALQGIMA